MVRPAFRFSPAFPIALAVLLALLHGVLAVTAMTEKSMTADEIAHLTAGQSYNVRQDYRLQPENGNLPQRLAAVPLTLAGAPLPPAQGAAWQTADVWEYGYAFFYQQGLSADQYLFLGRAMIALVSAALVLVILLWSHALFGWRGGFVSGVLAAFCPAFLAHGALATSDMVMTFCFIASVGSWWQHLRRPGPGWAIVSAIALGLALVAKFSSVLLPPMLIVLGVIWSAREARNSGWRGPAWRLLRTLTFHAAVSWAVIWVFYGFRFGAFAPEFSEHAAFIQNWGDLLSGLGFPGRVILWLRDWRALPEAWLYGLTFVLEFSRARGAFMSGEYSTTGWVTFFPWAFLIKTTLPFLLILGATLIAALRNHDPAAMAQRRAQLWSALPLLVLFTVYWITSLASNLNIGHRHILPTYPVLFILAGWTGCWLTRRTPRAGAVILALIGWHVAEATAVRPHHLAYFNQLIGGPSNGWRHLVDSSLDWGQDLPGLKRWLDRNARGERVFISYFGTGSPAYEGITATALPTLPEVGRKRSWHALTPGVYAISATMLQHAYSRIRGEWTLELEKEYQTARALEPTLLAFAHDASRRESLLQEMPAAQWRAAWNRYETLRFARLCHYLRVRPPTAVIGHSIFVFRLEERELAVVLGGSAGAWRDAIEAAVSGRAATARPN